MMYPTTTAPKRKPVDETSLLTNFGVNWLALYPGRRKDTGMSPVLTAGMPSPREVKAPAPALFTERNHTDEKKDTSMHSRGAVTHISFTIPLLTYPYTPLIYGYISI